MKKTCKPCAAARRVFPKPVRERLEDLERKMIERKEAERQKEKSHEGR